METSENYPTDLSKNTYAYKSHVKSWQAWFVGMFMYLPISSKLIIMSKLK